MIASRSCCRFVGCTSMMRISRSTTSQRCSIGLRSAHSLLFVCTSLLFILLFIKSQYTVFCTSYCFAHLIVVHFLFHCTFYSYFSFFYHIYALVLCYFYIILIFYSFALSTERTWFDYISLLIIPCIIYYVTNKETLNLEPWDLVTVEVI